MKRIVIVGASSGIGREVAELFIAKGYKVGLAARRVDALQDIARSCGQGSTAAGQSSDCGAGQNGDRGAGKGTYDEAADRAVVCRRIDVTEDEAVNELLALIEELGGMDIFLLCAGVGWQNPDLDADKELTTVKTNALGFTRMVDAAFAWFRSRGGHIAVISSIAGTKGLGAAPAYSATKRFQNTYIDALAQLARMQNLNISFTDIRPGFVDTDLLNDGRRYPLLMNASKVASRIVRAVEHRERVCTIDWRYRILVFFWRLIPRPLWERLPIQN